MITVTKMCTKCSVVKELGDFYNHRGTLDGKTEQCASCMLKKHKEYRQTDNFKKRIKSLEFKQKEKERKRGNVKYFETHQRWCNNNKNKINEYSRRHDASLRENQIKYLLQRSAKNAKAANLEFSLSEKDLIIPEVCPLLGLKLDFHSKNRDYLPSVDRINSSKGYIPGNVMVMSMLANRMKNSATIEQLKEFAKNVLIIYS